MQLNTGEGVPSRMHTLWICGTDTNSKYKFKRIVRFTKKEVYILEYDSASIHLTTTCLVRGHMNPPQAA